MDQMDYTMDDSHPNRQPNPTPQCQYQPNLNVSARENPHYDPVHDSTSWSPNNSSLHNQSRPSFGQPNNFSHGWEAGQYAPVHSWQGHNEHHAPHFGYSWEQNGGERNNNGPMGGMMNNSPWNDIRNEFRPFEPMTFGYSYHAPPSTNNNNSNSTTNSNTLSNQSSGGTSSRPPSALAPSFNPPQPNTMRAGSSSQHVIQEAGRSRTSRTELTPSSHPMVLATPGRAAHILAAPELTTARPYMMRPTRTRPSSDRYGDSVTTRPTLDSDEEDEADFAFDGRPEADIYFPSGSVDADRAMAALRGAAAVAKRVPSKAAIASLEILKAEDLKPADKTCIICYNDFGIANPEGLTEQPLRLPKCKHIFGDLCIKKWFEDSDSCPYCRDKLPAELSYSKTMAMQNARHRHAFLAATLSHRPQRGHLPRYQYGDDMSTRHSSNSRPQDEYELMMNRATHEYAGSSNRASQADFAENRRRQQPRGRNGNSRPSHNSRPMSVGSPRFMGLSMNHPSNQPRTQTLSSALTNTATNSNPRAAAAPGMARQASASEVLTTSTTHTPPRNRPASSFSPSAEEPSPPIAMGSGESTRSQRPRRDSFGIINDVRWNPGNPPITDPRNSSPGTSTSPPRSFATANFTFQQPQFGDYSNGASHPEPFNSSSRWSQ